MDEIVGKALPHFTTHHHLVELQAEKRARKEAAARFRDKQWGEGDFRKETTALVSNENSE